MSQRIDAEPHPRIFGNRELARLYIDDRISYAFSGQEEVAPMDDLASCAAVLAAEEDGRNFTLKIMDMMPRNKIDGLLQEEGYAEIHVDSDGLRIELSAQLGTFLSSPPDAQAARLRELGITTD